MVIESPPAIAAELAESLVGFPGKAKPAGIESSNFFHSEKAESLPVHPLSTTTSTNSFTRSLISSRTFLTCVMISSSLPVKVAGSGKGQ